VGEHFPCRSLWETRARSRVHAIADGMTSEDASTGTDGKTAPFGTECRRALFPNPLETVGFLPVGGPHPGPSGMLIG
jgi:hypothetical protein